jgi:hypothetical protein
MPAGLAARVVSDSSSAQHRRQLLVGRGPGRLLAADRPGLRGCVRAALHHGGQLGLTGGGREQRVHLRRAHVDAGGLHGLGRVCGELALARGLQDRIVQ